MKIQLPLLMLGIVTSQWGCTMNHFKNRNLKSRNDDNAAVFALGMSSATLLTLILCNYI